MITHYGTSDIAVEAPPATATSRRFVVVVILALNAVAFGLALLREHLIAPAAKTPLIEYHLGWLLFLGAIVWVQRQHPRRADRRPHRRF